MIQSRLSILALLSLLFALFISCDTEDPFSIPPPDFSTVPEPYDTANVESVELREGVKVYILDEGYGEFSVSPRDQVSVFISLRTDEGKVIYSSFSSDRTNPVTVTMSVAGETQLIQNYRLEMAYTPGFKIGLLGMKEGERRTIVVPPEQGYQGLREGHPNYQYRNNTLIYDVRVSAIGPTKR
ncbi:MAG: FKBP-type peptidyl-prolyl cis-trans isomerase [Balneolaceae bacterium]|nr:FKBP-type peptidyl-prolyl cis-trans isomerase [Balneolaceae bacterium]